MRILTLSKSFVLSSVMRTVLTWVDHGKNFSRLLMQQGIKEPGVFEGPCNSVGFSHDHYLLAGRKPHLAGNLLAWSGPGPQRFSKYVFHLMLDQEGQVVPAHASVPAIVDECSA